MYTFNTEFNNKKRLKNLLVFSRSEGTVIGVK